MLKSGDNCFNCNNSASACVIRQNMPLLNIAWLFFTDNCHISFDYYQNGPEIHNWPRFGIQLISDSAERHTIYAQIGVNIGNAAR